MMNLFSFMLLPSHPYIAKCEKVCRTFGPTGSRMCRSKCKICRSGHVFYSLYWEIECMTHFFRQTFGQAVAPHLLVQTQICQSGPADRHISRCMSINIDLVWLLHWSTPLMGSWFPSKSRNSVDSIAYTAWPLGNTIHENQICITDKLGKKKDLIKISHSVIIFFISHTLV